MLADDFFFAVALQILRARIPGHHVALRVEHKNCVILNAFDQQAKNILRLIDAGGGAVAIDRHWVRHGARESLPKVLTKSGLEMGGPSV